MAGDPVVTAPRLDPLSYTSSARLKVLVRPLRPLKQARFDLLRVLLESANVVRLEDVTCTKSSSHNIFNPKGLPSGRIVYDFVTEADKEHAYLEPLEMSRRIFAVIFIGDRTEDVTPKALATTMASLSSPSCPDSFIFSKVFLFDTPATDKLEGWPPDTVRINSNPSSSNEIRDAMSDFSSGLLAKISDLFDQVRGRSNVESPYDPASDFIRQQPQRVSAYALGDARAVPERTASPATERGPRFSLPATGSSDRTKMQGHGRASKACGDLLLICGFCNEAIKYYAEAAAIARANSDHLWHGAALEGVGVCLVMYTFLGLSYLVPAVALSATSITPSTKAGDRLSVHSNKPEVDLIDFLPELQSTIITLYQKSGSSPTDQVPPFVLAESSLRLAKLLTAIHLAGGLNKDCLNYVILGTPLPPSQRRTAHFPPRAEIAAWAMRAYQGPIESLSLADKLHIFSGLATVLGAVRYHRRRALFLREIVLALIPALVQARVAGAAGMGIHPAASLALSENQNTNFSKEVLMSTRQSASSLSSLLESLANFYGIADTSDSTATEAAVLDGYGWPFLQSAILKDCIAISEAIPDFEGVLKFSIRTLILNAACMGRDEQVRLVSNIPRMVGAARRAGIPNLEIPYWDQYIVRDVRICIDAGMTPVRRPIGDIFKERGPSKASKDLFLYNPYAKRTTATDDIMVVQNEPMDVEITLQNPFEFDVEAQNIRLVTEGIELDGQPARTFIKAQSLEVITLRASAKSSGPMKILGCCIKMSGCLPTICPIVKPPTRSDVDEWHSSRGRLARTKRVGLDARCSVESHSESAKSLYITSPLPVVVLPPAPILTYQPPRHQAVTGIAVLEGEHTTLELRIHNPSAVPVTFLSFSFVDSTTKPLEQAISSRGKQSHEIFELETFLYHRRAMSYNDENQPKGIAPYETANFSIQIYGKRGFTSGDVVIDYGNHSEPVQTDNQVPPEADNPEKSIYARRLVIPIRATVLPSIDIVHCDISPLSIELTQHDQMDTTSGEASYRSFFESIKKLEDFCVITMDVKNIHSRDLTTTIRLTNTAAETRYEITQLVVAGSQHRFVLPFERASIPLKELSQPVPALSKRQFVVSQNANTESTGLQLFWAREHLLGRLTTTWSLQERSGDVEKRAIAVNKRMIKTMLVEDVRLRLSNVNPGESAENKTDVPIELKLSIENCTELKLVGLVRIQIVLGAHDDAELGHRLILHGPAHFPVHLPPGMSEQTIRMTPVNSGRYKVVVSMEIIKGVSFVGNVYMARAKLLSVID